MKSLYMVCEGGASGHMAHPYDYTDYTLRDLKGLIRNLFTGKITDVTEKVDGTNIQATMNPAGVVVFVRNQGDLNSENGGMTISDMAAKWADKPGVAATFLKAGETITKVFQKIGPAFFNPSEDVKILANCECVVAGKTNIMYYASDQVDFHDLWVYKKTGEKWEKSEVTKKGLDVIKKACDDVEGAQLTPQILIKTVEDSKTILVSFIKELDKIWKNVKLGEYDTIDNWKRHRFYEWCMAHEFEWLPANTIGFEIVYKRWFEADKSTNIRVLKDMYKDNVDDLTALDKNGYKKIVGDCMEPLDGFFGRLGNKIIGLCDGIINTGVEAAAIQNLRDDIADVVRDVRTGGSAELNDKLSKQLNRLAVLGDELNAAEGIVFSYKGKLQKLTGSFASANQILGSIKFAR